MNSMDHNPVITPNQPVTSELRKDLEKLAEEKKNPNLMESFAQMMAKKSGQAF